MQNDKLWQEIAAHQFNAPNASPTFSEKLAASQKWSLEFARGAIEEYRRFLYLSQISDRPVTPSITIDAVWHLHMSYTRNYWDVLCKEVLRKPLHHEPGSKPSDETRHAEQFRDTKILYYASFGNSAPEAYWTIAPTPGPSWVRLIAVTFLASPIVALGAMTNEPKFIGVAIVIAIFLWLYFSGLRIGGKPISAYVTHNGYSSPCSSDCGSSCGGD